MPDSPSDARQIRRKVAILGASDHPDRISHLLMKRLLEQEMEVYPIHPKLEHIEGRKVYPDIPSLPVIPDILTLYINAANSQKMAEAIKGSGIHRVIFNPGAENPSLQMELEKQGVDVVEACSLVLLSQGRL